MSLPRKSRQLCSGDGFKIATCGRRASVLDGIVPRCVNCMRTRERTLRRISEGELDLEDEMLRGAESRSKVAK